MPEPQARFTVFIVDDDPAIRDSLSLLLSLRGYRTATFALAGDLLAALDATSAGCVVADLKMPAMNGLELQSALLERAITVPVVIITAHGDVASARRAFRANAVDFLEKPFDENAAVAAVEAAFARERQRLTLGGLEERRRANLSGLTDRERGVAELLVQGLHNRDVAERLGISPRTVEVHKARVMAKLGTRNLVELIRLIEG